MTTLAQRAELVDRLLHEGRVLDPNGLGVAEAIVAVVRGTAPTPEIGIRSNDEGRFRIALPPGKFEIEARAPDGRTGRATIVAIGELLDVHIVIGGKCESKHETR
jgi:hypothetical protein